MMPLSHEELAALRYYIGDADGEDAFWGDAKAYVTLNSLFFPGTATERARASEGKRLNPAIISDTERLVQLFENIITACIKSAADTDRRTFRVERFSDYELCRRLGRTVSFTSTSTAGFLTEYRDRLGIALMRFTIPAGTPCADMSAVLESYSKPGEAEIMLPPFVKLDVREVPLSDNEKLITDCDGAAPGVSCEAVCGGLCLPEKGNMAWPDKNGAAAGARVYEALMKGEEPESADAELYSQWKEQLISVVSYDLKKLQ